MTEWMLLALLVALAARLVVSRMQAAQSRVLREDVAPLLPR